MLEAPDRLLGREDDDVAEVADGHPRRRRGRRSSPAHAYWRSGQRRRRLVYLRRTGAATPSRPMPSWPRPDGSRRSRGWTSRRRARDGGAGRSSGRRAPADQPSAHLRARRCERRTPVHLVSLDDSRIVLDQLARDGKRPTGRPRGRTAARCSCRRRSRPSGLTERRRAPGAGTSGRTRKRRRHRRDAARVHGRGDARRDEVHHRCRHRPHPRCGAAQRRRAGAHQHRHARHAAPHHGRRTARPRSTRTRARRRPSTRCSTRS